MTSLERACLWISHLAILVIGVMVGLQVWDSGEPAYDASSESSGPTRAFGRPAQDASPPTPLLPAARYADAWETLKDKRLSREERQGIQHALLRDWSVVDLASAIRAVFAEATRDQDDLLRSCGSGIVADPSAAWELVMAKAFGWESARVRKCWLEVVAENEPLRVFEVLDQVPLFERLGAVDRLAHAWSQETDGSSLRDALWTGFLAMGDKPWGEKVLFSAGEVIGGLHPLAELDLLIASESSPAAMKLLAAAYAISLKNADDEEFEAAFPRIPAAMRAEVAAAGLTSWNGGSARMLDFAELALAEGNIDVFPHAAAHGAFAAYADETGNPSELVDWALGLPDDPRVLGVYSQALRGATRRWDGQQGLGALDEIRGQVKATLNKVTALPPGLRRDRGIADLVQGTGWSAEERPFVDPLVESIGDPDLRAAVEAEMAEPVE